MKWIWPVLVALSILGVGLLLTGVMENRYIYFATYVILQYIVLATAWNILGGYTGYVNFGTPAFFALGPIRRRSSCSPSRLPFWCCCWPAA